MTTPELILKQTKEAHQWVNRLLDQIPMEKWDETPDVIESNINWQIGHLILAANYHSVRVIVGKRMALTQDLPLREYAGLFGFNTKPSDAIGKSDPTEMRRNLLHMQQTSENVIAGLSEKELLSPLESAGRPHPIAETKLEALSWYVQHTLWHCGQIALIKRVVDQGMDFSNLKSL